MTFVSAPSIGVIETDSQQIKPDLQFFCRQVDLVTGSQHETFGCTLSIMVTVTLVSKAIKSAF